MTDKTKLSTLPTRVACTTKSHKRSKHLAIAILASIQFGLLPSYAAQTLEVQTLVDDKNAELYTPAFIPESSSIAVVRKLHEPDGHEAESFSEADLQKIHDQKNTNPRWADPEVLIVSGDGKERKTIDFGWAPEPSTKGDKIYYVHQKKPISGLRILAEPQKGNELFVFDSATGEKKLIVEPPSGYIDNPIASPDGKRIAYTIGDATNGEWGGAVGVGMYDPTTEKAETILPPTKHFELFDLIGPVFWQNSSLFTGRMTALEKGLYLADKYSWEALKLTDSEPTIMYKRETPTSYTDDTRPRLSNNQEKALQVIDGESVIILDAATGKKLSESKKKSDTADSGVRSPDGKFEVLPNGKLLEIKNTKTGKKFTAKLSGELQTLKWSPDSNRLIAVVTKNKSHEGMDVFDHDCLIQISIPAE